MKASGAWLVPTYNGVSRLDKPSSYFKLVAHSLSVFGENETAARLPSALCGLGLLVILWGFVQRVHGSRTATLAVFGMLGLFARWLRRPALSFLCLAFFTPVFLHVNIGLAGVIFEARSARRLAREIGPLPAGTEMAAFACYPDGLSFYLARTMTLLSADGRELSSNYLAYALRAGQPWPAALVRLDDAPAWLASRRTPVYIIARGRDRTRVLALRQSPGAAVRDLPQNYIGAFLPRARIPSPPAP